MEFSCIFNVFMLYGVVCSLAAAQVVDYFQCPGSKRSRLVAAPVVNQEGTRVVVFCRGSVHCLDAVTLTTRWSSDFDVPGTFHAPPVIAGGHVIIVSSYARLYRFELETGISLYNSSSWYVCDYPVTPMSVNKRGNIVYILGKSGCMTAFHVTRGMNLWRWLPGYKLSRYHSHRTEMTYVDSPEVLIVRARNLLFFVNATWGLTRKIRHAHYSVQREQYRVGNRLLLSYRSGVVHMLESNKANLTRVWDLMEYT